MTVLDTERDSPPSDKGALRRTLIARRRALTGELRRAADAAIGAQLLAWCEQRRPKVLGVYSPIRGEPDLADTYARLRALGIALALPLVQGDDLPLQFAAWPADCPMTQDRFGVAVPAAPAPIDLPEVLLVPCVGFNSARFRLGYGGGFYDRTLAHTPRPVTIGVAYACQATAFLPGAHDIALDMILTD